MLKKRNAVSDDSEDFTIGTKEPQSPQDIRTDTFRTLEEGRSILNEMEKKLGLDLTRLDLSGKTDILNEGLPKEMAEFQETWRDLHNIEEEMKSSDEAIPDLSTIESIRSRIINIRETLIRGAKKKVAEEDQKKKKRDKTSCNPPSHVYP